MNSGGVEKMRPVVCRLRDSYRSNSRTGTGYFVPSRVRKVAGRPERGDFACCCSTCLEPEPALELAQQRIDHHHWLDTLHTRPEWYVRIRYIR